MLSHSVRIMQYHGAIIAHICHEDHSHVINGYTYTSMAMLNSHYPRPINTTSEAKFSTNYFYHAKCDIYVQIRPLFLIFIPLTACKEDHFYWFRVARICVPMSSYELRPVVPGNNDLGWTKMSTKLSHLKCIHCWCATTDSCTIYYQILVLNDNSTHISKQYC